MNYFRQSLISIPTYLPALSYRDTISLYSIDDILNEPVSPKDRKDLNKIYEQADIFVKRNSIVTINNKKQKKLISSTLNNPNQAIVKPIKQQGHMHQLQQIIGRQNAFFQQIHPADVQKNHEDNIFDYRLHMKLARGQEIFKVEQVKRKIKKRNISGKECQCCAKQVMKNHRCQHTLCDQKCGKVVAKSEKINENSKKQHSSLWSESKQQNWEDENAEGSNKDKQKDKDGNTKVVNLSGSIKNINQKQKTDKGQKQKRSSSKLNRGQSSSSNKSNNGGQVSQYLLLSIQKLLMSEMNDFTYKVIQIKQYEQNDQQQQDEQLDNKGDMQQQDDDKDMIDRQQLSQQQEDNKYDMDDRGYVNNKQIKSGYNIGQIERKQMSVHRLRLQMNNNDNEQLKIKDINRQQYNNNRLQNDNKEQKKQDINKLNNIQQRQQRKNNNSRVIQYNLKLVHLDIQSSICKNNHQLTKSIINYQNIHHNDNNDNKNNENNYSNDDENKYNNENNKQDQMISQQQQMQKQKRNKQIDGQQVNNQVDMQQNNNQKQQNNNNQKQQNNKNQKQQNNKNQKQQNNNNQKQQSNNHNSQTKQNNYQSTKQNNQYQSNINKTGHYKKISIVKNISIPPIIPSSQSSSQSIVQPHNNNKQYNNHNNNYSQSQSQQINSINQNNNINNINNMNISIYKDQNIINSQNIQQNNDKNIQSNQQDHSSIPEFQSQNSLDQEMDEIFQQQINTLSKNQKIKINKNKLNSTVFKSTTPQKLNKKQSKKIKMIQKQKLLSENIQEIDPISDGELQLNEDQQKIQNNHQSGLGKGKGRGMGRGKGIFQQELDIYQQNSQILHSQKQQEIIQNKSHLNVKYSPNKNSLSQPILPNSESSVQHPTTPRRHIPDMQTIIQQIRSQAQNNSYEKGLGRGKIFGRGLGVLQQAQQIQKQIQQYGISIDQQQGFGKARKKIKRSQNKMVKSSQQSSVLNQDEGEQIVDKFDELIEEQIQQGNIVALNNLQVSRSMDDRSQARYLRRYLQKRQSVIDNLDCGKYELSEQQEKKQIKQLQKQQGEMDMDEINDQRDLILQNDDKGLIQNGQNVILQVDINGYGVDVLNGQQQLDSMMNIQMKGNEEQYQ